MEITSISGVSGWIKGGTNTGIVEYAPGLVLVIDAGHSVQRGRRMAELLQSQNLIATHMLSTHEHFDHFEAFAGIREHYGDIRLLAHPLARASIDNRVIGLTYLTSSSIPKFWGRRVQGMGKDHLEATDYRVDQEVEAYLELGAQRIALHHVPGHSAGSVVAVTEDGVGYFGDAILDRHVLDSYDIPFLFDIALQERSLLAMKELPIDYGVIAHAKTVFERAELMELIDRNLTVLHQYEEELLMLLKEPKTREDLVAALMQQHQTAYNYVTYQYNYATVGAYLAKLSHMDAIDCACENHRLYYFVK